MHGQFGFAFAALAAYLICAVPFGLLIARFALGRNLRDIGSGSTGATNVLRTGSKAAAAATLALDAAKPVFAKWLLGPSIPVMVLIPLAVVAHCWPVYLKGRGGKGVATAWGTMFLISWRLALSALAVWLVTLALTRKSSLSAIVAGVSAPLLAWVFAHDGRVALLYAGVMAFVVLRHAGNIKRLLAGTEDDVRFKR
ncbi:MAG: glycerol-3-phosphate 1-O-acyltransferase PlsY [Rickettsiales bacterium]|jgi:glycerol-3-phosphate acyltransferase PlsY|nr:glycerol-3-phosphate 1-O-acyltransferase PlsY [Rickettsiales bacterium]